MDGPRGVEVVGRANKVVSRDWVDVRVRERR